MIIKMKKLSILGLISQKKDVLDALRNLGCFELVKANDSLIKNPSSNTQIDSERAADLHHRLHILGEAISSIEKCRTEFSTELKLHKKHAKKEGLKGSIIIKSKTKKPLFSARIDTNIDELNSLATRADDILKEAKLIQTKRDRIEEIRNLIEQNNKECAALELYKNVDVTLNNISDSKNFFMLLGTVDKKALIKNKDVLSDFSALTVKTFSADKTRSIIFVTGAIDLKEDVLKALSPLKFSKCKLSHSDTPKNSIASLKRLNNQLWDEKIQIFQSLLSCDNNLNDIKMYYDWVGLEIESLEAQKDIASTKSTFCIEGWVPSERADELIQKLSALSPYIECELSAGEDGEIPPTLTKSNALVSPYESVTNMYSPPSPFERDPNPFVAIFFFIFFGIIIGDAVYGLGLFLITLILLKCYKMETNLKKLVMIMCMGGISTFIFGAIYNSWAAVGLPYNPILNPVEHPFDFLMISLGLGYVQITFGFLLKLIANIRARDFVSALADSGWKLFIMIGLALNIPTILSTFEKQFSIIKLPSLPPIVCYIGLSLIFLGLIGMLITGGRKKQGLPGKIISGLGSWYDLVGLLSDILSYCRLFGLALSGAIIGTVANILAKDVLFPIPYVGYVLGIAVAVFFHLFNLALACLGAYVHNSRLQFVEFFGKFYEGGGRTFRPLGSDTKFVSLKQK